MWCVPTIKLWSSTKHLCCVWCVSTIKLWSCSVHWCVSTVHYQTLVVHWWCTERVKSNCFLFRGGAHGAVQCVCDGTVKRWHRWLWRLGNAEEKMRVAIQLLPLVAIPDKMTKWYLVGSRKWQKDEGTPYSCCHWWLIKWQSGIWAGIKKVALGTWPNQTKGTQPNQNRPWVSTPWHQHVWSDGLDRMLWTLSDILFDLRQCDLCVPVGINWTGLGYLQPLWVPPCVYHSILSTTALSRVLQILSWVFQISSP